VLLEPRVDYNGSQAEVGETLLTHCKEHNVSSYDLVEACTGLELTVEANTVGLHDIEVTNPPPANCSNIEGHQYRVVERPRVDRVVPPVLCTDTANQIMQLEGEFFLRVDGLYPEVQIELPDGLFEKLEVLSDDNCTQLTVKGHELFQCMVLTVKIKQKQTAAPYYPQLRVTPPHLSDCEEVWSQRLLMAPQPTIERFEPPFLCLAEGDQEIVIHGRGFYIIDGALPSVSSTDPLELRNVRPDPASCVSLPVQGHNVTTCDRLLVILAQHTVPIAKHFQPTITVTPPGPVACSITSLVGDLLVIPRPKLLSVSEPVLCLDSDHDMSFFGEDLYILDGQIPDVAYSEGASNRGRRMLARSLLATNAPTSTPVSTPPTGTPTGPVHSIMGINCTFILLRDHTVEKCAGFQFSQTTFGTPHNTTRSVVATNPPPADCSDDLANPPVQYKVVNRPFLTAALPSLLCVDQFDKSLTFSGSGLFDINNELPTVRMTLGPNEISGAMIALGGACTDLSFNNTRLLDCTTITATIPRFDLMSAFIRPAVRVAPAHLEVLPSPQTRRHLKQALHA
jgi:hypothetical protein